MRWKAACRVILLVCLMLPAGRVMAATGATRVTGSVPLITYEVSASHIGYCTATISWKTNGAATSQVFYDTVSHDSIASYACYTPEYKALVKKHKVTLNKLSPSTTYYYRVRSAAGGTEFVSDEYTFKTLPFPRGWRWWWANLWYWWWLW
jgi:FlaG/FlaF family flagellin (archaellin)